MYGEGERASEWMVVEQEDINKFADATHDPDWMHIDPERAKADNALAPSSPYISNALITRLLR